MQKNNKIKFLNNKIKVQTEMNKFYTNSYLVINLISFCFCNRNSWKINKWFSIYQLIVEKRFCTKYLTIRLIEFIKELLKYCTMYHTLSCMIIKNGHTHLGRF